MKRWLFLAIAALTMTSCSYEPYTRCSLIDFTRYTERGFYVIPFADFNGHNYQILSQLTLECYPGKLMSDFNYSGNLQDATDDLVASAISLGANGILNFDILNFGIVKDNHPTHIVSGTAVVFTDLPQACSQEQYSGKELADKTVEYCIDNNIALIIFNEDRRADSIYDINTHRYIPVYLYMDRYGNDSVIALEKTMKKALKGNKKK